MYSATTYVNIQPSLISDSKVKITRLDYFLVFWVTILSGSPTIQLVPGTTYLTGICGVMYFLYYKKYSFFVKVFPSIIFFAFIFTGQYFTLGYLPIKYPMGLLVMILAGAFVYHKLGYKFRFVYFNVIYFFCAVSLFFWALQNTLGVTFDLFNISKFRNVFVWGVRNDPYKQHLLDIRNSGPFWEPGAFAGYIILLVMLYLNDLKMLWNKYRLKCVVILIALITTFSTTGYVILFIIVLYKAMNNTKHRMLGYFIVLPILIFITYFFFIDLDFIGTKIISQYESAIALEGNSFSNTRVGALLFDLQYIEKHPFFGNGNDPKTRWSSHMDLYIQSINGKNLGHGNGFSGYLASMGIPSLLFIVYNLFISFKKSFKFADSVFIIIVFLLLLQGESFLNYPLMFSLYFIKIPKQNI